MRRQFPEASISLISSLQTGRSERGALVIQRS